MKKEFQTQPKRSKSFPPRNLVSTATAKLVYVVVYIVPDEGDYDGISLEAIYSSLVGARAHPKIQNGETRIYEVELDNGEGGREVQ